MMGQSLLWHVVALVAVLFGFQAPTWAAGFGGYLEYSHASSSIDYDDFDADIDFESDRVGFGFLFDSNVASDRLFNYRFQGGYQYSDVEVDESGFRESYDASGFAVVNSFGFGFLRNDAIRLWAGPELRLTTDFVDVGGRADVGIVNVGIGTGPQVGINWHVSETASLTASLAYKYLVSISVLESDFDDDDGVGGEHLVGLNFGVLFRTVGDRY